MQGLKWEEHYDSDDNTFWVADIKINGCDFCYRIKQGLKSNKKVYIESSDYLARFEPHSSFPEWWTNLEDAKYDMWRHFLATFDEKDD